MSVRRKERVWVPATVEHDGDEIALVEIRLRINGDVVPSRFWVNVSDLKNDRPPHPRGTER